MEDEEGAGLLTAADPGSEGQRHRAVGWGRSPGRQGSDLYSYCKARRHSPPKV